MQGIGGCYIHVPNDTDTVVVIILLYYVITIELYVMLWCTTSTNCAYCERDREA
jgi:hypothetical protein